MEKNQIRKNLSIRLCIIGLLTLMFLSGCQQRQAGLEHAEDVRTIKIARQFGLAYAPLTIMEEKRLIELENENIEVEWVQLGNTAAIREAILTDELDFGFMGIPPYLIGLENGMDWQVFTGLSRAPLGLMTSQSSIEKLRDIEVADRIALPQPGSIQHILLAMAAQREMGKSDAFDSQLVSLKHPDGVQMLTSGSDISLHFTSPPYIFEEEKRGMRQVISGEEAFGGPFTFIVGTVREQMAEDTESVLAIKNALEKSIDFMQENPEETLDILSKAYGIETETLKDYIYEKNMVYETDIKGMDTFIDFMIEADYIHETIKEKPVIWEP
ncbi:ABC transporter substrate-binding protein [Fusibacter sp. JL216-2]|uniref:ABC transporter substrate-binding protein n=1 Tax=Fusibacter sp. JL216-2 TaxID=3071453 RepID=UPI003D3547D5